MTAALVDALLANVLLGACVAVSLIALPAGGGRLDRARAWG